MFMCGHIISRSAASAAKAEEARQQALTQQALKLGRVASLASVAEELDQDSESEVKAHDVEEEAGVSLLGGSAAAAAGAAAGVDSVAVEGGGVTAVVPAAAATPALPRQWDDTMGADDLQALKRAALEFARSVPAACCCPTAAAWAPATAPGSPVAQTTRESCCDWVWQGEPK